MYSSSEIYFVMLESAGLRIRRRCGMQVLSPLMRVSPAYGEVVTGVFALIAYQVWATSDLQSK